ncbi:MAG: FtsX-like permease family protein [Verrucomicrobiota bacterium]
MASLPTSLWRALFHPWTWRMAWRDSRSQRGRLALYALSIAAGICALTAIHALKASVQQGIDSQARALLGADVLVSSRRPISDEGLSKLAPLIREMGRETGFSSMIGTPSGERTRLVQVRAVEGGYPFGSTVETDPPDVWRRLQTGPFVLVEPALLVELGVQTGQSLKLGGIELTILGTVTKGVPRSSRFSGFSPEIFIRHADLEATGLVGVRSLVFYHRMLDLRAGTEKERKTAVAQVRRLFPERGVQVQTPEDRREMIGDGLDKAKEFLGITALAALLLGGIGVAGAIHTHIRRRVPTVAVLLVLGCPTNLAFGIYLAQAAALGLVGAIVGALLGAVLHAGVVQFAGSALPFAVRSWPGITVLVQTTGAGFLLCCGFALLPLLRIRDISPLATLTERETRRPGRSWREAGLIVLMFGLVWGVALLNGSSMLRALILTGALAGAFLVLTLAAFGLMRGTRLILQPSWPYLLRQGVSNLFRPHNQTLLFLLSLGLGVFLLLTTWFLRDLVLAQLRVDASPSSPNLYLVDVQPDQAEAVRGVLTAQGYPVLEDLPMVTMRIESVKGVPLSAMAERKKEEGQAQTVASKPASERVPRRLLEREFRSTYRTSLNATETIIAGAWPPGPFSPDGPIPVSLEQQLARDLHVVVGDELVMDVQGLPVSLRVACLRKVDWSKFNLNFVFVFPPGVLEAAPQFHLMTTRIPSGQTSGGLQRALLETAPNVSAVDLTSVLATVSSLLAKASKVIQLLAGFTILAGLPILAGALLNGREQRVYESVLLRTLGASERQVRLIILIEYAALGTLSAFTGAGLALLVRGAAARWVFKSGAPLDGTVLWVAVAATVGGAVIAGWTLSRDVCRQAPLAVLRQV